MNTKKPPIAADEILKQLAAIAKADISDYMELSDGNAVIKPLDAIPARKRAAIALIKNGTGSKGAELKLYDKMRALELLGKYLGLFDTALPAETDSLKELDDLITQLI